MMLMTDMMIMNRVMLVVVKMTTLLFSFVTLPPLLPPSIRAS